ncbi:MAG: DUF4097 family beta strand repeat-containing protein [Rhodothermales bacterium]|nr:DUF4097 family beta strand repeat-containing protein [Rhodothermales bacterium]
MPILRTALFTALLLLLAGPALAQRGEQVYDQSFPFRPGEGLSVSTSSSDVFVRARGGDGARVVVYGRGDDYREAFERLNFTARREGDGLVLKVERGEGSFWRRNSASFDIVVMLPEQHDLTVATSSGDLSIDRVRGDLTVSTSSGDIELDQVRGGAVRITTSSGDFEANAVDGDVEISTSSGDFSFDTLRGAAFAFSSSSGDLEADRVDVDRFRASTSSGDIEIEGALGAAEVSTSSGDVSFSAVEGPLAVSTSSGDVEAALTKAAPVEVNTGSGNVRLAVPRGLGADLSVRGGTVRIDDGLGFSGDMERRRVEGRLGDGGDPIRIRTGSGTVALRTD